MIAGLDCDLHHLFLLKHHLKLMAKLNLKKESLKARNNKLHAKIWRMNREKDSTQTIDRMRIEIDCIYILIEHIGGITYVTQDRTRHPGFPAVQLRLTCDQICTGSESLWRQGKISSSIFSDSR